MTTTVKITSNPDEESSLYFFCNMG
jgi:hypothetical protein